MKKNFRNGVILSAVIMTMVLAAGCGNKVSETPSVDSREEAVYATQDTTQQSSVPEKEEEKFDFPINLDEKSLELGSVFEYTGMNPDCENAYGEEIASIQLKNVSGKYLKSAKVSVVLSNGDTFEFLAQEVPADMEIMAFDIQNQVYDDSYHVEDVQVETEYGEMTTEGVLGWSVDGSDITVENKSDKKMKKVTVYYHCTIDELGYGGKAYELTIDSLQPGESKTVTDEYCFVGDVKVSNIVYND